MNELEQWLKSRPSIVRKMARRFPPGTRLEVHDKVMYVVSYYESGGLSVSEMDPCVDYETAVAERVSLCACCIAKLESF